MTRHTYRFYLVALLLALWCGTALRAQHLTLSTISDTITTDEELVIVLDGELGNFSNYATLPDVQGLVVISHQETFSYSSSSKSAVVHQTYAMKAINPGDYTIGPAWIQSGSRRVFSNVLHVHVKAGDNPMSNGMVLLRAEPSKKTVYAGEEVEVYVRLYVADGYSVSGDYPIAESYSGFWRNENYSNDDDNYDSYDSYYDSTVYIKGKKFRRRTLLTEKLYPNATGNLTLPTYTYSCYLSLDDEDVYNYDTYDASFDLTSEQSVITVLTLPDHDTLPGFAGDVGKFTIKTFISADSTNAWEPVYYTMWVTGEGNFQFMMAPDLNVPAGLRAVNVLNSDTSVWVKDAQYAPARMFRYQLTPEKEGEYDLSNVGFSYFDPQKKSYVTVQGDSFHLHVNPGVQIVNDSVNNLPDSFFEEKKGRTPWTTISICAVLLISPVLGYIFIRRRKQKKLADEAAEKARLAAALDEQEYVPPPDTSMELALALVHGAGQYLQNGLIVQSVNNLYEAMIARIMGMTRLRREEISVNTLRYKLRLARLDENFINAFIENFEELKLKRYTMSPADTAAAHVMIVRTSDLLRKTQ